MLENVDGMFYKLDEEHIVEYVQYLMTSYWIIENLMHLRW